ncbi:DctP family TRAP transporter solute-binding subunit [Ornithinimicrobium cavernae]|uniref:DctP family TRAP transporter solute-binding subunit n=1 Tax=Ornithinimicrobium cavernae TaxID=2666047 RepID=UPI001F012777|nr:DctP family TRAP transporter solute-binding subunit [Ornithinimicrobium cavernae]
MKARNTLGLMSVVLASGLVLTACGGGDGASADGETYEWDFTVTTGNTSTWFEGAELFADQVEEKSGGRMKVNIFPNEQLSNGNTVAGLEQLMNGEKDLSFNSTIIYASIDPKFGAVNAPFLYTDLEQARATLEATGIEAYKEASAEHGVQLLAMGESGFRQLTNSRGPVRTPEDLKALKIRIPGIGLFDDIYKQLGANPTTMTFSEVFTSLQQGTIDGQENPIDIIYTSGLNEVQDHLTVWNYVYDPLILGMNKDVYDSMSPEDQAIVEEAAKAAAELQITNNREKEDGELEELRSSMEVIELTEEEATAFREAMNPVYEQYQDIWGEDLATAVTPEG